MEFDIIQYTYSIFAFIALIISLLSSSKNKKN